jgi:hypothetical protein
MFEIYDEYKEKIDFNYYKSQRHHVNIKEFKRALEEDDLTSYDEKWIREKIDQWESMLARVQVDLVYLFDQAECEMPPVMCHRLRKWYKTHQQTFSLTAQSQNSQYCEFWNNLGDSHGFDFMCYLKSKNYVILDD